MMSGDVSGDVKDALPWWVANKTVWASTDGMTLHFDKDMIYIRAEEVWGHEEPKVFHFLGITTPQSKYKQA